jgi:LDH2 family malate/lactate/ureidoglycolate dehydrogenase
MSAEAVARHAVAPIILRHYVASLYRRVGVPRGMASQVARIQVETDMRGVTSHGTACAIDYVGKLRDGRLNPAPRMRIATHSAAAGTVNADRAAGPLAATVGIRLAVRMAKNSGVGCVVVTNAGHFGAAGSYVLMAAASSMIGIALAQTGRASIAPQASAEPLLGNTPLAMAFPRAGQPPVLVDFATGGTAWRKIHRLRDEGAELEPGVALDAEGNPTVDPALAATLRPFGGAKGSALAIGLELLVGMLAGVGPSGRGEAGLRSHLFWVVDPGAFGSGTEGQLVAENVVSALLHARAAAGHSPHVPGATKWSSAERAKTSGLTGDRLRLCELVRFGRSIGIDPPDQWS